MHSEPTLGDWLIPSLWFGVFDGLRVSQTLVLSFEMVPGLTPNDAATLYRYAVKLPSNSEEKLNK